MLLMNIADIPEMNQENVYIRDKPGFLEKINKIISEGHSNLQIVTDFDHTITRQKMDDGTEVLSSFGMFRQCRSLPQNYRDEGDRLSAIYRPVEANPMIPIERKIEIMTEWYKTGRALLKGLKFPRSELDEISKGMVKCFRHDVDALISWSEAHQVPVLVFSAGLGESVVAALNAAGLLLPNVKVVSNFLDLDENDVVLGNKGEMIHSYNKNEAAIKNTEYYELVRDRSNVIVMGDNIGDAGMADGMDHCDVVIKVGFLGHSLDNLQSYMDHFDVVLVDEPSVALVNAILKRVL